MAILAGLTALGMSFSAQSLGSVQKNRRLSALQREHSAVRDSVFGIRAAVARNTQCAGHPYTRFQGGVCVPDALPNPPTAAQAASLGGLRNIVFRWPEAGILNLGQVNPPLDRTYFTNSVRGALIAAGCIACHNGTPNAAMAPDVSGRNFSSYDQIAQLNGTAVGVTPVASRFMINSRLGKKLLATTFSTSGFLAGSVGLTHWISFRPLLLAVTESVRNGPLTQSGQDPSIGVCPGPCPPGEVSEPTTCQVATNLVCNPCGKKKCQTCSTVYTRTWSCIRFQNFSRSAINVTVSSVQSEPTTGQNRFIATEGTLQ